MCLSQTVCQGVKECPLNVFCRVHCFIEAKSLPMDPACWSWQNNLNKTLFAIILHHHRVLVLHEICLIFTVCVDVCILWAMVILPRSGQMDKHGRVKANLPKMKDTHRMMSSHR